MRANNPLKPGAPILSSRFLEKLVKALPLISVAVAIAIVSFQYAKRQRIHTELMSAQKEYKQLEKRMKDLQKPPEKP